MGALIWGRPKVPGVTMNSCPTFSSRVMASSCKTRGSGSVGASVVSVGAWVVDSVSLVSAWVVSGGVGRGIQPESRVRVSSRAVRANSFFMGVPPLAKCEQGTAPIGAVFCEIAGFSRKMGKNLDTGWEKWYF